MYPRDRWLSVVIGLSWVLGVKFWCVFFEKAGIVCIGLVLIMHFVRKISHAKSIRGRWAVVIHFLYLIAQQSSSPHFVFFLCNFFFKNLSAIRTEFTKTLNEWKVGRMTFDSYTWTKVILLHYGNLTANIAWLQNSICTEVWTSLKWNK